MHLAVWNCGNFYLTHSLRDVARKSVRYTIVAHLLMAMNQPQPIPGVIDSEFLWGFWYPALRSDEIRGRALATSTRLDVPLVLGRDAAGKAFALRDVCPHRAFPLSAGHCDGQTVECTYHGWRFDAHTGQCREIPSITADSKLQCDRIYAGSFPCEERDGRTGRQFLPFRSCRNSASAIASRISSLTFRAVWTQVSLG